MKKIFYLAVAAIFTVACSNKGGYKITVQNPSNFDRASELVEIPLDSVKAKVALTDSQTYVVKNSVGKEIPSQITFDGKLIFQSGLRANETRSFTIEAGKTSNYQAVAYSRLVPERYDDYAWENDRVAFRIYGQALKAVDGPSNGLDLWYKRTSKLVIDEWYKNDIAGVRSYHDDNAEGLDNFDVGHSLGGGAMAPYADGKLFLNENFVKSEDLDKGPLRITFRLIYNDLDVNGNKMTETRTISLDAGSQLSKIVQTYGNAQEMQVASGIVRLMSDTTPATNKEIGYMIYSQPKTSKTDSVYIGVLAPNGVKDFVQNSYSWFNPAKKILQNFSHNLAIINVPANASITYYAGYGWAKWGFATENYFETYIKNFADALRNPFVVRF